MTTFPEDARTRDVNARADAFVARLPEPGGSFADDLQHFSSQLHVLLDSIRASDVRFAFDRDGRPAAVAALKAALPTIERDLLDAVLEDHEAEIAAWKEALYQGLIAQRRMAG